MKNSSLFKNFSISLVWTWLFIFALLPFIFIIVTSFLTPSNQELVVFKFSLDSYKTLFNFTYLKIFEKSFYLAGISTLVCLVVAYPFAYIMARANPKIKNLMLLFVIIPFWTNSLIRSYSMLAILKAKGLLNTFLIWTGIIHIPLQILYTNTAVIIGLVYNLLPFMILPLYANIERLDMRLIDAAKDLGANKITTFRKIIIPLTIPGILAGCIIVFLPAMTLFYIPDILGGAKSLLLGNLIEQQFLFTNNWPAGSATSVILTLIMALMLWFYFHNSRLKDRQDLL